ncbi:hypothetical protein ADK70_19875 [Streptomyces rimosus subsp. pseudoverticillatus]|uniref:hypothetical protein n=1 Tax=Streptomyces rimosus TaxID=1927 RepID=UPI0006B2A1EC|nr:hypothetical protein [Streptomyces rimosus]KOT86936.1 hypothetical protein ADK70_19875 [Streptomyces rimosus subsp. pseudoverticillatus]
MITFHAPPTKEAVGEPTAATRHLCTGVYVDERFRDLVIDKVCTAPHRRVAPSYGFDIVPVMHHAWRAATLTALLRMTLVGAVIVPALTGALPTAILIICGLALLLLLRLAILFRNVDREPIPRRKKSKRRGLGTARGHERLFRLFFPQRYPEKTRVFSKRIGVAAISLILTGLTVALVHPDRATTALHVAAGIALMCLGVGATRQVMLNHIMRAPTLRPGRLSGRQRAADIQQHHVCAVYRRPRHREDEEEGEDDLTMFTLFGDESPFVGAGELVYQWNPPMSIQLLRPGDDKAPLHEREHPVPPFQAHELVEYLRKAVQLLNTDSQDVRLPAQVRDRVYVAETDVAVDRSLLPQKFDEADLRAIINTSGTRQHHFLEVTTPTEGAEFVATVLLHVSLQGRTLIISTAACVLAHTPRSFQRTEEFGHHGITAVALAAFRELVTLPVEIERSWRIIRYIYALGKAAVLPRDLTSVPIRNVLTGSRVSVRESSSQTWSKVQLEKSDILGRLKTIEQRLLHAADDFLCAKGVDTSEFNDRALKIINSGIFNLGDNNTFNGNAVGDAAQVSVTANQSAVFNNSGNEG